MVATEHVGNKYSTLGQALDIAAVFNLIKFIEKSIFALNLCTEILTKWICKISTQISKRNSTFKVDFNGDMNLGQ